MNNITRNLLPIRELYETLYRFIGVAETQMETDIGADRLVVKEGADDHLYLYYYDGDIDGAINMETGEVVLDPKRIGKLF